MGMRSLQPCPKVRGSCATKFAITPSQTSRAPSLTFRRPTVNEGAARLNIVLASAHRSADSSRRRRPCEAKRKGDHRGGKEASRPNRREFWSPAARPDFPRRERQV